MVLLDPWRQFQGAGGTITEPDGKGALLPPSPPSCMSAGSSSPLMCIAPWLFLKDFFFFFLRKASPEIKSNQSSEMLKGLLSPTQLVVSYDTYIPHMRVHFVLWDETSPCPSGTKSHLYLDEKRCSPAGCEWPSACALFTQVVWFCSSLAQHPSLHFLLC